MSRAPSNPAVPSRAKTAREVALGVSKLASFPDVYFAVRRLVNDPDSSLEDIADVLVREPALAAGILRLANSAYFGLETPVTTVNKAVSMLGMVQTHDFVLATVVMNAMPSIPPGLMDMRRFWRNSIIAATAARYLADASGFLDSGRLFLLGLLAQLGRLAIFLQLPEQSLIVLTASNGNLLVAGEHERTTFGFDYATVGSELLTAWNLPPEMVTPIRQHAQPAAFRPVTPVVSMLHVAVTIANGIDASATLDDMIREIDGAAWECLELTADKFASAIDEIAQEGLEQISLFAPASVLLWRSVEHVTAYSRFFRGPVRGRRRNWRN